ncbi:MULTISPECIES: hypothetical protein [unclassified Carboxylicivirga]|uniref:hypothetical protein n=1 Tax=Carboxylicivirga TaxID=1628153 RepID=UPI003D346EB2
MKNKNIFLFLLAVITVFAGCDEQYNIGTFDVDSNLMPGPRTDGPMAPAAVVASYDAYCDKVEVNWLPTVRTTAYDLYKNGEVLAAGLTDTFYVDTDALSVDTEYTVYSKNANGDSETASAAVGRMAMVPPTPVNFAATDGEYEAKVDLSWDPVDFAQYYILKRGDVVLSDAVVGTVYSDNVDAPTEPTEYTLIAVGVCGESPAVTTTGYCDPLIAFLYPINENFDGYDLGFNLSSLDIFQHIIQYDATGGPGAFTATDATSVSGEKSGVVAYNNPGNNVSQAGSIQLIFKNFTLLEGQRYRISYKLKCDIPTSMHIAVDGDGSGNPSKGDGVDNYLLPTAVNTKNGNLFGIQMAAKPEWTEVSYEFPATGDLAQNNLDPDPVALGWTPTTIQAGQETPLISITYWVGKGKAPNLENPPIYIDDLMIELIR